MNLPALPFPNKPLKLTKITQNFAMMLFLGLLMLLGGAGIGWWQYGVAHDIYTDHQIGKNPQILENARIDGECKTRKFAFTDCKATIRDQGNTYKKSFAFFDFSKKDYEVMAVANASNPQQVSLDLAIDKIGNRIGFLAFFVAVALLMLWAGIYLFFIAMPRQRKIIAAFNAPGAQPWQPAAVAVNQQGNKYAVELDGQTRNIVLQFGKNKPWVIGEHDDGLLLLGIQPKNGGNPIPLDQKLSAISGLNKTERQNLIAHINQQFGS
ncbi:MAG: hypothetical protein Q4D61_08010 [Cardiobacteriaceae bacterium]|nr:hypothetical protein [Cardiobacteriaceae bacterium]